jgi:hypothetical protein
MAVNIAKAGYFSSDRTIDQYNNDIWHLEKHCRSRTTIKTAPDLTQASL